MCRHGCYRLFVYMSVVRSDPHKTKLHHLLDFEDLTF